MYQKLNMDVPELDFETTQIRIKSSPTRSSPHSRSSLTRQSVVLSDNPAKRPPLPTTCGLSVFNVVGKLANIIRLIIAVGILYSAVISVMNVINVQIIPILVYIAIVVQLIALCTILFDASTAQWLVEKVLNRLTSDVKLLESAISGLTDQLSRLENINLNLESQVDQSEKQLQIREMQISQTDDQIMTLSDEICKLKRANSNFESRVNSLRTENDNLNKEITRFSEEINTLEQANAELNMNVSDLHAVKSKLEQQAVANAQVRDSMNTLLTSMLNAQKDGVDMNELLQTQVSKLERAVSLLQGAEFEILDRNRDGVIDKSEFSLVINGE